MRRCLALVAVLLLAPATSAEDAAAPLPPPTDAFDGALTAMGLTPADLGYRPKATWARYPHPNTTPYVLPFFEDLLANPLDTYAFTRTLANAVEDHLTPAELTAPPTGKDRRETLFKLGVMLATDRRIGGFRGYSANLDPQPHDAEPLLHALVTLLERAGKPLRRPMSFGGQYAGDAPTPLEALRKDLAAVPAPLHRPFAKLVLNLVQAREWIDLGLRRVPLDLRREVFATLPKLAGAETSDGIGYHPVIDDVARLVDEHSLHYGCLKALQAVQDARRDLEAVKEAAHAGPWAFDLATPWGRVVFSHERPPPTFGDGHRDCFLIVGDAAQGFGATTLAATLSVALQFGPAAAAAPDAGASPAAVGGVPRSASGVLGCGIVYAAGAAPHRHVADTWSLGAALFGLGALIDEGGDDTYVLGEMGQGAALFGAGLLLDAAGNDIYRVLHGDAQGFGGPNGIGVLADRSGDDHYYAEPDAKKAGRADYHSQDKIAANNAQGVGSGRRGDGSDGHNWAGGLGALLDVDGDDVYEAGNFSQGLGYWYGTGLLWDGGGNDRYKSVYFTQGSGAHFAVGALIDESGDDVHELWENAGAALGFGWDVVNAFLIDRGQGNDRYTAQRISLGVAEVRSNAFFLDEGGDDTYVIEAPKGKFLGDVDTRKDYTTPARTSSHGFHLGQVGVFLDLGGTDRYLRRDAAGNETVMGRAPVHRPGPAPDAESVGGRKSFPEPPFDGLTWNLRVRDPQARHGFNVSIGRDVAAGRLGFLDPWPARAPPDKE